jgi:spore coat protein CotF
LYQQNPYQQQQQGLGGQQFSQVPQQTQGSQFQGQQVYLEEQDLANFVLSELKRVAREYTTAVLEANNQQIRQTFQSLLQKTLQDQAILYQELQKLNGYGDIQTASQQDIQKELQKQSQSSPKLQSFVQQNLSGVGGQQSWQQNQGFAQQQNQGMGQQQAFHPSQTQSASPLFPSGVYGQSPISYTGPQVQSQQSAYNPSQGFGHNQGAGTGSTSYGAGQAYNQSPGQSTSSGSLTQKPTSGYLASSSTSAETAKDGHQAGSQLESDSYSGTSSSIEGSSSSKQEGSKYSF